MSKVIPALFPFESVAKVISFCLFRLSQQHTLRSVLCHDAGHTTQVLVILKKCEAREDFCLSRQDPPALILVDQS